MNPEPMCPADARRLLVPALLYALFIVYGSLIPFDYHARPLAETSAAFEAIPYLQLGVASRADWVANILLYIPLAFLLTGAVAGTRGPLAAGLGVALVAVACIALAFAIEFAQLYFPPRTVSQNDLIAETIGTAVGIGLWFGAGPRLLGLWRGLHLGGPAAHRALLALYVLGYLALAFFPYDLLVSGAELQAKLANPAAATWGLAGACGGALACSVKLGVEILVAMPIGAMLALVAPRLRAGRAFFIGLALGAVIETGQLLLASGVSQGLSLLTRALGVAWGLTLQHTLRLDMLERHARTLRAAVLAAAPVYVVLLALVQGFSGTLEPRWVAAGKLADTHFLPFYYHYFTTETAALWSLLAQAGAYAPVGIGLWLLRPRASRPGLAALLAALLALAIETLKLFVPGLKPDPTNLLIAASAAALVNAVLADLAGARRAALQHAQPGMNRTAAPSPPPPPSPPRPHDGAQRAGREPQLHRRHRPRRLQRRLLWAGAATAVAVVAIGALLANPHVERPADESTMPQLPPGAELPPVVLPGFRQAHPRLPHPSDDDIARLRRDGGPYLDEMRRLAQAASPNAYSWQARAVLEFIDPGSQDLATLHAQLMTTKFEDRGHDQVRPLAVAYDWLHDRWSPDQRAQLRSKLADGCEYLIQFIRTERLSPYNVYLYNAPFQALVACSLALWRDDPRGEPVMRFTADLWQQRVLPVWRQVMGQNGGWHEGGEYVGIGIGNAIWEVPAMWRSATGEDLFAAEPGIRGFLDFVIHRTRPDGTHLRIGDGAFFDRNVPARLPLAIE
ncbi:MAG: VanZ family protein, partial [Proteobacteria bacterium]|nr:VanZ family protein [Pseudomonadota bacterium]